MGGETGSTVDGAVEVNPNRSSPSRLASGIPSSARVLRADTGAPVGLSEIACSTEPQCVWSLGEDLRMVASPLGKVVPVGMGDVSGCISRPVVRSNCRAIKNSEL